MEKKIIGKYERQEILLDHSELHDSEIIQLVPQFNSEFTLFTWPSFAKHITTSSKMIVCWPRIVLEPKS